MENQSGIIAPAAMFKLSYGLFVLTARDGDKDNGCIINTAAQLTSAPLRISITVNKANFTHDMIIKTGEFNVSILTQLAAFAVFEEFGFHSGKDTDKFAGMKYVERTANGITHLSMGPANAVISAKVKETVDCGTHTLFVADVTQTLVLSDVPSATYQFYFDFIKPKPAKEQKKKKGFVCKICGYVHEGDSLPEDFVCPICKHSAADFEPL
jgi:flavin reductase (DIM6/NTAB) family NADH-FMN oxidoreductase RutF